MNHKDSKTSSTAVTFTSDSNSWENVKTELLKKPSLRTAYERVDLEFEIAKMVSDGRIKARMTQQQLAEKLGTSQPVIAKIEAAAYLPSLNYLQRIAAALGTELLPPSFKEVL